MTFEQNLQNARINKSISVGQLAEIMGVDKKTVTAWESGRRMPSLEQINRLEKGLNAELLDPDTRLRLEHPELVPREEKKELTPEEKKKRRWNLIAVGVGLLLGVAVYISLLSSGQTS